MGEDILLNIESLEVCTQSYRWWDGLGFDWSPSFMMRDGKWVPVEIYPGNFYIRQLVRAKSGMILRYRYGTSTKSVKIVWPFEDKDLWF